MAVVIDRFEGPFLFLSNFYPGNVFLWDMQFHTAEHAYQYEKIRPYTSPVELAHIMSIKDPGKFKRTVKRFLHDYPYWQRPQQEQWDRVKVDHMRKVLQQKFSNVTLHDKLMDTRPLELIEGNMWNDAFWGVPLDKHGNRTKPGLNWLGKLLMELRDAG